jgi:hypothetical protein
VMYSGKAESRSRRHKGPQISQDDITINTRSRFKWILIDEFIGTTSLGNDVGHSFLYPSVLLQPERRKKETKIYVVVFSLK